MLVSGSKLPRHQFYNICNSTAKKHQEVGTTKGQEPGARSIAKASLEPTVLSEIIINH